MAFFRESARTVRLLLMLVGLWLCGASVVALVALSEPYGVVAAFCAVDLLLGCFYTYLAARLEHLLVVRPNLIVGGLLVLLVLNAIWVCVALSRRAFGEAIQSTLAGALGWYVIVNVRRLAGEARYRRTGPEASG